MSKRHRQSLILEIIKTNRVASQEGLRALLHERDTEITQATLSRDIRELRLVKVPDADGAAHYSLPDEWESTPPLEALLPALFQRADGVQNLLVVRTLKGGAQTVAAGIDWEEWPEVMGTLAGDDTILIILRDAATLETVQHRIEHMAGVEFP